LGMTARSMVTLPSWALFGNVYMIIKDFNYSGNVNLKDHYMDTMSCDLL